MITKQQFIIMSFLLVLAVIFGVTCGSKRRSGQRKPHAQTTTVSKWDTVVWVVRVKLVKSGTMSSMICNNAQVSTLLLYDTVLLNPIMHTLDDRDEFSVKAVIYPLK